MIDLGDWNEPLAPLFADERYKKIREFLKYEYSHYVVYPDMYDLFNCFRFTPFSKVKAVLLGQDPYHNVGQAHGLCFSVQDGIPKPPSLENMLKELKSDLGYDAPKSGNLTKWAKEGVLLMNTALTVREHLRLELVHGQRDLAFKRAEGTPRLYSLGRKRAQKSSFDRREKTLDSAMCAPLSALRLQRIFRLPSLFQNKRLSYKDGASPH